MPAVMSAVCACLSSRFAGRGAARSGIPWHSSGAFWRGCSFAESAREKVAGPTEEKWAAYGTKPATASADNGAFWLQNRFLGSKMDLQTGRYLEPISCQIRKLPTYRPCSLCGTLPAP
jgi:hypothetical protein